MYVVFPKRQCSSGSAQYRAAYEVQDSDAFASAMPFARQLVNDVDGQRSMAPTFYSAQLLQRSCTLLVRAGQV